MNYQIKRAAVIGSGTMGGGIATLLVGVGIDVILLDIPAKDTQPGDPPAKRNAIVANNLKTLAKMRPAQAFVESDIAKLRIGNIDDDLGLLADVDWVIEVVIEKLDVKQSLMAKLAEVIGPQTIVTTNTSGLPIHKIAEHLPEDFTRRFMGTHFFNPPRYLKLLEVIPHPNCDPALVDFMMNFGTRTLGKGVVLCKDTPNFIGNRFMSMSGMQAMNYALDHGYTVEEVDALTGPLIGRPKTATFNLNDLVGFDVAVYVARNLYDAIPDDPQRDVLNHPKTKALSDALLERKWLGRKTNQGFYLMKKREDGEKEFWALNLETLEYEPPRRVEFESVKKHQKVRPTGERIRLLINEDDRGGQYLFHLHAFYLAYASHKVGEITESILNIDNAQKWGFGHEMGPFEIWDAIGVSETVVRFEGAGYPVAQWVKDMIGKGHTHFYLRNKGGVATHYYSPQAGDYVAIPRDPLAIRIDVLRAAEAEGGKTIVASNDDGAVYDIGDGVLLWEFRSKQNTITAKFIELGEQAVRLLDQPEWRALVVANEAERFSIGANLTEVMQSENVVEAMERAIRTLQELTLKMKYAPKPVITAPAGMALGGGCELSMAGHTSVPHAETYIGLVEFGVGLVPAGGGCKEMIRRLINPLAAAGADVLPGLQKAFENIALAKVSESAAQARDMGFFTASDKIVMSRDHLIGEAKAVALALAETYVQRPVEKVYAAGRDAYAALKVAIAGFREAGQASEHDALIASKIAYILTGGALAQPQWVEPQYIFALERQAFMELAMHPKTQERIMHMLTTNKPLRN
ncbi:MAG: 3-hydroxyacyl-CoA dehydrogenase NAD-binding domain-containing protein [Anaerolineae bacterium]|nr:3-hydroxyacyl-CoA dehydrogenase NAD-binding domain-containing protein [Anaerolineae bacterium]MDW8171806.1 3-hydroxyacyl-CoA dehydrogenase NAD-binding domain-containing protein [Anaerolineae bacterium]